MAGLGSMTACVASRPSATQPTHVVPSVPPPTQKAQPQENPASAVAPIVNTDVPSNNAQAPAAEQAYLAVARGNDAAKITTAAIAAIGGIERFVKPGSDVVIKPNICTDYYSFEYAATTNPDVVATLVRLCLGAGAKRVRVMDNPFGGSAESAYARSGIGDAVSAAGGQMELMNRNKYQNTAIPDGRDLKEWSFYQDVLNADVFINVPIAKHHSLARLSLGGKNLLGVITRPGMIHANMGQRVADLVSRVRPTLTVIDAVRILMSNGPTGGNLDDVKLTNTVIASHDIVAADAYATTLFGLTGADIGYIQAAADMGLGTMDVQSLKVEELSL